MHNPQTLWYPSAGGLGFAVYRSRSPRWHHRAHTRSRLRNEDLRPGWPRHGLQGLNEAGTPNEQRDPLCVISFGDRCMNEPRCSGSRAAPLEPIQILRVHARGIVDLRPDTGLRPGILSLDGDGHESPLPFGLSKLILRATLATITSHTFAAQELEHRFARRRRTNNRKF